MRVSKECNLENKVMEKENILVDKDSRTIRIKRREKLLAIKDKDSDSWKFLGDNSEYRKLYPEIYQKRCWNLYNLAPF